MYITSSPVDDKILWLKIESFLVGFRMLRLFKRKTLSLFYWFAWWLWLFIESADLHRPCSTSSEDRFLFFMLRLVLFHIWFAFVHDFLDKLHGLIRIFRTVLKIVFIVLSDTVPHRPSKLLQHLQFHILQILFFKPFLLSSFEFYWALEVLYRSVVTKQSWYFFGPVVSTLLLVFGGSWGLRLCLIPISKLITDGHVFVPFLFLRIASHTIVRALVVSDFACIEIISLEIVVRGPFFVMVLWMLHLVSRIATVVRGTTIGTFQSWRFFFCFTAWVI